MDVGFRLGPAPHEGVIARYFVYYGSRTSQPARARAFVDLAVERLTDYPQFVLTSKELVRAQRPLHSLARKLAGRAAD